eukprot:Gregarina_sp_Poly_1__11307@NODE_944_length_5611_cov_11_583514_g669_i0_p5_GENE_NODE_944_length_5611_cov_11_583514_g669_i0NODE_944_length_5611_cov_11_583514_g669_i0_p5_ORF_typecomplete_len130_score5_34_NODE_944_length_5611_cov_11_583514_g669_i019992388
MDIEREKKIRPRQRFTGKLIVREKLVDQPFRTIIAQSIYTSSEPLVFRRIHTLLPSLVLLHTYASVIDSITSAQTSIHRQKCYHLLRRDTTFIPIMDPKRTFQPLSISLIISRRIVSLMVLVLVSENSR